MKNIFVTCMLCIFSSVLTAQDIAITFQSIVDTVSIDSISATNLRTNQNVKLLGGESLLLVKTPTSITQLNSILKTGYIYPNPTDGDATISFSLDKSEDVEIGLYNSNGQLLRRSKESLAQGMHNFSIKFPVAGIYYLTVIKRNETSGFKAVYSGRKTQNSSIVYEGSEKSKSSVLNDNQLKSATTEISLAYIEGDVIQYSCFSGVNTTIVSDIPIESKIIDVEFVSCVDNDDRSYKAVKIGDQWWMAENLAYLPAVSPSLDGSDTEPIYYVHGYEGTSITSAKQQVNYTTYGVLYNWPAALAACPSGWHLPTDAEWTELTEYVGGIGIAGDKLKETGTSHWANYNIGATNEEGFSALPGSYRSALAMRSGSRFRPIGYNGYWWSSTESSTNSEPWIRILDSGQSFIYRSPSGKDFGLSVRCVRD